jgi:hypothetical protein
MKITKLGRLDPVKKNMDKFHRPSTHKDKTKYDRKNDESCGGVPAGWIPKHPDYRDVQRGMTDLNWDGE